MSLFLAAFKFSSFLDFCQFNGNMVVLLVLWESYWSYGGPTGSMVVLLVLWWSYCSFDGPSGYMVVPSGDI